MKTLNLTDIVAYIHENVGPQYHDKKIQKLRNLTLNDVIKRKNPYLFKAKHINDASEYVASILDATASSREETIFGDFLENIAIRVCELTLNGRKSGIEGIDLEFEIDKNKYLVVIKSGPNWGNSGQLRSLKANFIKAKKILNTSGGLRDTNIIFVEGCCYGVDDSPEKGTHQKLCGQRFWELISGGNENLYKEIIEPLGYLSKEKNEELMDLYTQKKNLFVKSFLDEFCDNGIINWDRLITKNSGKKR
jgi:hypothetical protein